MSSEEFPANSFTMVNRINFPPRVTGTKNKRNEIIYNSQFIGKIGKERNTYQVKTMENEKAKYKDTACTASGRCGPVCVCKRITRGYRALKSFKAANMQNETSKANSQVAKYAGGIAMGGSLTSDVIVPAATSSLTPEGLLVAGGVAVGVVAAQSLGGAYLRGKAIDRSMMKDRKK